MSRSTTLPRHEQIAELTANVDLPLPPIADVHMVAIAEVLVCAWNALLVRHADILKNGDEAEINALLESRLNALLDEDPIWEALVCSVARGKESLSFDAKHLEKRPDLSIHLTRRNPSFSLIVECKLIDQNKGKTVDIYCSKGLVRFIRGEYAWASREAFMLAYKRDDSTIPLSLTPFLDRSRQKTPDAYLTAVLPESRGKAVIDFARSSHGRAFEYSNNCSNILPGEIAVWHLWVSMSID